MAGAYVLTSLDMLDRTYGHLIQGSEAFARERMDAHAARLGHDRDTNAASATGG